MDESIRKRLLPGAKVKVIQQFGHRNPDKSWPAEVRGTILEYVQRPTGSWFAHAKEDKLWLDRLKIKKEDGELLTLILDEYSHVEVLEAPQAEGAALTE
jgi:hypothetical protein